jgi:hypothetical protein
MLRDNKANVTPSQIIDPVDKTTIIDKKGKIEKCLIKHFGVFLRVCQTVFICHGNVLVY